MSRDFNKLLNYVFLKISLIPIMLWIISTLVFILLRVAPGDPVDAILGSGANEASRELLRSKLGLDESLLSQYVDYINNIEYPEFNNYTFKTKYDVMYIGVYKTIKDFHFLQKNKLFTLHHSGLQELYKKHNVFNEKIIKLKERLQKISN